MALNFANAEFIRSAASPEQFLRDGLPQFAFAGRSNVGKSSVINRLTGRRALAYVGKTPGKTAQVNYYRIDGRAYLVDLPGYGYARVSRTERERWGALMEHYFQNKGGLITLGVLIVDARHRPTGDDETMFRWFCETERPVAIVANKVDQLRPGEIEPALSLIRDTLGLREGQALIPFSASKGTGKEQLLRLLSDACQEN